MIGYSSHSAGCALTQSIPSAPAVCNHRSSYRQTHLKRYVGFTFSSRLPIDNIRFGQPETPMYLRPFLPHRTVPYRTVPLDLHDLHFHSVVADLGGKAENLLTDESFRSWQPSIYPRLDTCRRLPYEDSSSFTSETAKYALTSRLQGIFSIKAPIYTTKFQIQYPARWTDQTGGV